MNNQKKFNIKISEDNTPIMKYHFEKIEDVDNIFKDIKRKFKG